jgi:hypothetical protein
MRIAAGITMIITAVLGITILRTIYGFIPGLLGWLPWLWATFVVVGGIETLRRKDWVMCLIAGIFMTPVSIVPFLMWRDILTDASGEAINIPFAILVTLVFLAIAILPVVSVLLRKGEWHGV